MVLWVFLAVFIVTVLAIIRMSIKQYLRSRQKAAPMYGEHPHGGHVGPAENQL